MVAVFLLFFLVAQPRMTVSADEDESANLLDSGADAEAKRPQILLKKCQDHLYSAEYDEAIACFDRYIEAEPDNPVGYWRKLNAIYSKIRSINSENGKKDEPKVEDKVEYAGIMVLCDIAIEKTEIKLQNAGLEESEKDFYLYVKESTFGLKALFQFANGAPWSAKENAEVMLELSKDSKYPDAPAPIGLMEYRISRRGFFDKLAAKFFGFPANREHGLGLLARAFHGNNSQFSDDIRFMIVGILIDQDLKKKDREKAEKILGVTAEELFADLCARYPRNRGLVKENEKLIRQK